MNWDFSSRMLAETLWAEYLEEMTPKERSEMVRRQDEARKADYWQQAFESLWAADEALKD